MFIEPDEYLIIMDMNHGGGVDLTLEEMQVLKAAGVRTLYYQAAIRWDVMQPQPDRPMDWSVPDRFVNNARRAGLKMLIPFVYSLPPWWPDDFFYSRSVQGLAYGIPNYANEEMTAIMDEFMVEVIRRYGGADCQVIYAVPANGEFAVDLFSCSHMPYPMELFTDWVVKRQQILVKQFNEVWTAFHPYSNPVYWKPVYGALYSAFPFVRHYGILFTWVQHTTEAFWALQAWSKEYSQTVYFGGTEYVQGMKLHVPKLLAHDVRMLTAPKHPFQQHRQIEDWMLPTIRWAIGQYEAKYAG